MQTSGASRREIAKSRLDVIASGAKQSIFSCLKIEGYVTLNLAPQNAPVMPGLIRASIHLRNNFFRTRWVTGSSSAKTRGACRRAAPCPDPLAL
jgi:hypothetical protein